MTLRRRPFTGSGLGSVLVVASLTGAAAVACGSDDAATSSGGDGGSAAATDSGPMNGDATTTTRDGGGGSSDGGAGRADGAAPTGDAAGGGDGGGYDTSPVVPEAFPLDTPGLGGYALADAFPAAEALDIPSVITFARTDTADAHPFVLERTGQIRRLADDGTWDYQHPVVDFGAKVNVQGEGGAVGMVLHPKFGDGNGHARLHLRLVQRLQRQHRWPLRLRRVFAEARALHLPRRHEHRGHADALHRRSGVHEHPQCRPDALRRRWVPLLRKWRRRRRG